METPLRLKYDTAVYRCEAIKKAAYKFGDLCYVRVSIIDQGMAEVELRPRRPGMNAEVIAGEFDNEVLDQELRDAQGRPLPLCTGKPVRGLF